MLVHQMVRKLESLWGSLLVLLMVGKMVKQLVEKMALLRDG